jgi:hypothetical protein
MNWKTPIAPIGLAFSFLLLFSSCKKDTNNSTANNGVNRLKLYIEDDRQTPVGVIDTFTVTYDARNRITGLVSPALKTLYTYSSNTFTCDLYENNVLSIHYIAFINGQSLVDSTFQYDNTSDTTTEKYLYSGKILERLTDYNYSTAGSTIETQDDYVYDANGNLTTDTQSDGYGDIYSITSYTYSSSPLNISVRPFYFALQSKDFPATVSQSDGLGDTLDEVTYSYKFDSSGRVTSETDDDTVNNYIVVKTYVYQ